MAASHARASILTRERAFEDAWITYQNTVNKLSAPRIAQLALLAAVRLADGSFDLNAGLGKHMAERTILWRLSERREQYVEDMIARPLTDMIAEEIQSLDEEIAWWATMSRPVVQEYDELEQDMVTKPNPMAVRTTARANLLRVMESKRKLLGLDRPQRVEVLHDVTAYDDPATTKLKAAMQAAQARRDEMLAQVQQDDGDE